jgi:phosphoribosylaminoimidazole-succinocarboxamide synthase
MSVKTPPAYLGSAGTVAGLERVSTGKVRDIYRIDDDRLLFVTTDRISAFDVVMNQGIPHKGRVLTAIAAHWFERTRALIPNHLLGCDVDDLEGATDEEREELRGRIMIVRACAPTPVEWVVRGYITGSGWKDYQRTGAVSGVELPAGLEFCERLPEPIFTPSTKDDEKDVPITADEARRLVGDAHFEQAVEASRALFAQGTDELAKLGILLADTKFEFGIRDGELILIDEVLTPDSSRFWPEEPYATRKNQPSLDKQILRDHLETLDWDKRPPAPHLDQAVLDRVASGYLEICERITGSLPEGARR